MKRKSTRWIALLLALVLAFSLLPGAALAAEAEPSAQPDTQTQTEDTPAPTEEPEPTEEPAPLEEPTPEPETSPAPTGQCSNGYLSDLKIFFSNAPYKETEFPGFSSFSQTTTNYNLDDIVPVDLVMHLSIGENYKDKDLYAIALIDGERHSDTDINNSRLAVIKPKGSTIADIKIPLNTKRVLRNFLEAGDLDEHVLSLVIYPKEEHPWEATWKFPDDTSDYDIYNFKFSTAKTAIISQITIKANNSTIKPISPPSPGTSFKSEELVLGEPTYTYLPNQNTLDSLAVKWNYTDNLTLFRKYGDGEWTDITADKTGTSTKTVTVKNINLEECIPSDSENARIQLKTECGGKERILTLEFILPKDNTPVILAHPQGYTREKTTPPTSLSVAVENPDENITYQWQSSSKDSGYTNIPDATSNTYTPPANAPAGDTYYRCCVTRTVNEIPFTVYSDGAKVTVELTYVNQVTPIKDFPFAKDAQKKDVDTVRTEYEQGEKFGSFLVRLPSKPEPGTKYKFEVLYNTTDSIEGAQPCDVSITQPFDGSGFIDYAIAANSGFQEVGDYYIFCKITGVSLDETMESEPYIGKVKLTYKPISFQWLSGGTGVASDPFLIKSVEDLKRIQQAVNEDHNQLTSHCFKLDGDITLPQDWTPIGTVDNGKTIPFAGQLDGGGHTVTVATEGKPLFNYVRNAVIKNLNIYGKQIDGCGLVDGYFVDYGDDGDYWNGTPECATLENVRLLSGSSTKRSGIIAGSGSGANTITMRNCVVEENVTIGYTGTESGIGSFGGGHFNGQLIGCTSYATVKGASLVGGLVGGKGESMGKCSYTNCGFAGTIEATGDWVGGIIGVGYVSESAPNTMPVSFNNCYVAADITGNDYIGGIFGGEGGLMDAFNECILSNSSYYGKITAKGSNVGGIIGYYKGVNTLTKMENNYFCETGGTVQNAIGKVEKFVIGSGKAPFANAEAANAWLQNVGSSKTEEDFKNGTVAGLLNSGETSMHNWAQGPDGYPIHDSEKAVLTALEVSGELTRQHYLGDPLDTAGLTFTAVWSTGKREEISAEQITFSGYNSNTQGVQTVTCTYEGVRCEIEVMVLRPVVQDETITVYLTLLGDTAHGPGGTVHTQRAGNLETWISRTSYTVDPNATVWTVLKTALDGNSLRYDNPSGNYVVSITRGGVELAEFTNGTNSGWMYTINGVRSLLGVSEQFLNNGDMIVFHYTDDFTKESGSEDWGSGTDTPADSSESPEPSETLSPAVTPDASGEAKAEIGAQAVKDAVADAKQTGADEIVIEPQVEGSADKVTVELDKSSVDAVAKQTDADLTVKTGAANVTIPQASLDGLASQSGGKVSVSVETKDGGTAIQVAVDGKAVEALKGGLKAGLSAAEGQVLVIVEPDGTETVVKKSVTSDGRIDALLNGSCTVKLADNRKDFDDVADGVWYDGAVDFASSRELFVGVSESAFAPDLNMSRGMLATVLWRLEDEQDADVTGAFTDVADGTWYTEGVAWASQHGIVEGYDGKFAPDSDVTREQLATMLWRYAKDLGLDVTASDDLDAFADGDAVSGYASDAVKWAVGAGLIQGKDGGRLDPAGDATRAEVAMILERMVRVIVA